MLETPGLNPMSCKWIVIHTREIAFLLFHLLDWNPLGSQPSAAGREHGTTAKREEKSIFPANDQDWMQPSNRPILWFYYSR
uniref:Uncharacterized protein n=1 Tax=Varanus komodoensis TaxID=61221 RepID=A0A8D2J8C8_VARKO